MNIFLAVNMILYLLLRGPTVNPMPDIIPISELRQDATNVLKRATVTGAPVFVTQNGKASAVVGYRTKSVSRPLHPLKPCRS